MIFEKHMVTQEKWHRSYAWQMTLRLGLSEPPCAAFLFLNIPLILQFCAVLQDFFVKVFSL